MSAIYKFPCSTPIRYLPLVYILPHDLLRRCPTLRKLSRNGDSGQAGAKAHSAVVKRMEAIKRRLIQYGEEAGR